MKTYSATAGSTSAARGVLVPLGEGWMTGVVPSVKPPPKAALRLLDGPASMRGGGGPGGGSLSRSRG
jgi:hypothetical protein